MNTIDIVLLGIMAAFALWGFAKGFISTIVGLVGYVVAFIAARTWGSALGQSLRGTGLMESLSRSINSNLANMGISGMDPSETSEVLNNTEFGELLSQNPAVQNIFNDMASAGNAVEGITELIVNVVSVSLGFLIIFLAVKILISLIGAALSGLSRMSRSISFVNRFFGLITGSIIGVALATVTVVFVLPLLMTYNAELYTMAQSSTISKYLMSIAGVFI
ncbi:MAG: CvpA family protein [Clostridia bacterium]